MWCGCFGAMAYEKMELECDYFTNSQFSGNNLGYNSEPGREHPEVAREMTRKPTSNVPSNLSPESLQVAVKRVSLLLNKPHNYTPTVLNTFEEIETNSCNAFYVALVDT